MPEIIFVNFRREPIEVLCNRIRSTGRSVPTRTVRLAGHWRLTYVECRA
jgi:hypothetical protein